MNKAIEITVAPNGEIRVETIGFTGSGCRDASRFLEDALGRQIDESLKPEFHQTVTESEQTIRHQW